MLAKKDGNFHKDMKMNSAIRDQLSLSLEQGDKNKGCDKSKGKGNAKKEELEPNSNKANRLKAYEQITHMHQSSIHPTSKAPSNYHNIKHPSKKKEDIATQEKESKTERDSKPPPSNSLGFVHIQETITKKSNSKELLDQFEEYYLEKFSPLEKNAQQTKANMLIKEANEKTHEAPQEEEKYFNVSLDYFLGLSYKLQSAHNNNLICYHKQDKWFAYTQHNLILIERFQDDSNRGQIRLNSSKVPLSSIKLSLNGKILYSCHHSTNLHLNIAYPPFILFYSYKNSTFKHISQCDYPSNEAIIDYSMSPTNSFCIVSTIDSSNSHFISCLDYIHREILIKAPLSQGCMSIKWNTYVSIVEFITFEATSYSIWTINTKDVLFNESKRQAPIDKGVSITSLDYTPPMTLKCIIMLLIALSNGTILVYDYEANALKAKYTSLDVLQEVNAVYITDIAVTMNSITVIYNKKMRYFRLPLLSHINEDNLNLFSIKNKVDMEFDSDIISSEFNTLLSACQGILLTSLGYLYYFNFEEESNLRLFHFNPLAYPVKDIIVINNNIKEISLQNYANADSVRDESQKREGYTIVTAHAKGIIKIWSIPEYYLKYTIDVKEEICLMTKLPNDNKLIVSYYSGLIRVIDSCKGDLIGKTTVKAFIGDNNHFKLIKFFPEGKYCFSVDNNNDSLYLVTIASYSPFVLSHVNLIHSHFAVIREVELSIKDPFNLFLIADSKNAVKVFSRKYMTLIQDLSFDKSVPQYDCIDTFDLNVFIANSAFPHVINRVKSQFSPHIQKEPDKIYIATTEIIIQRDFLLRSVTRLISFDIPLIDYHIASDSSYALYVFNEKVKYSQFADFESCEPKGNVIQLPSTDAYLSLMLSSDSKYAVIAYSFGFAVLRLENKT